MMDVCMRKYACGQRNLGDETTMYRCRDPHGRAYVNPSDHWPLNCGLAGDL